MPTITWPRYKLSKTTFEAKLRQFFPQQRTFSITIVGTIRSQLEHWEANYRKTASDEFRVTLPRPLTPVSRNEWYVSRLG